MTSNNYTHCWLPDQYSQSPDLVPCDPSAEVSVCCTATEACTASGYCYGNAGTIYRGACTDKTFRNQVCPQRCLGTEESGGGDASQVTFLSVCQYHAGGPPQWTCGFTDCSLGNFSLGLGAMTHLNISGNITSVPDSTQTAGLATVTVTAAASGSSRDATTIGLGVGISLGVALLLALGYIIFLLRKIRKVPRRSQTSPVEFHDRIQDGKPPSRTELSNQNGRSELYGQRY